MGLGNTAKKVQKVADMAEKLYSRVNELRDQLQALRQQVDATSEKVDTIERDLEGQRALLAALAEQEGIDSEAILAESAVEEGGSTEPTGPTGSETTDGIGTGADEHTAAAADSTEAIETAGTTETDGSRTDSGKDA